MNPNDRKLLIVDDEPIIADGLQMLFEEQRQLKLDVSATCSSMEAIELFERVRPDVVLLDIQMPGISGLELAGRMKSFHPEVKIIFLTGYDQFDYAYKAIKQDAFDYVLKTEGDDKVIAAVTTALDRLEYEQKLQMEFRHAQIQLSSMFPVFRQNLLVALLAEQMSDLPEMAPSMVEIDEMFRPGRKVVLILGRFGADRLPLATRGIVQLTVEQILQAQLLSETFRIVSVPYSEDIVWFIIGQEQMVMPSMLVSLLEDTQSILNNQAGCPLSFAVASEEVSWLEVGRKYQALRRIMVQFNLHRQEGIVVEGAFYQDKAAMEEEREYSNLVRMLPRVGILEAHLQNGHQESFLKLMNEFCQVLSGIFSRRSLHAMELYLSVCRVLLTYINENQLSGKLSPELDLSLLYNPDSMTAWAERAHFLSKTAAALCDAAEMVRKYNTESTIARIKDYINHHLSSDLSLTALGKATGFNPSYLSRMFKRDEGIGLHDYITDCRINLAKSLLMNTNMKIYEIAQKSGYDNSNYFIRTFKLLVGQTPQEYRNQD
ncbi:two-component system response regulator YesN [Fontibacillus phaseoli]|uniref:Two-component system response regulator YesN n=1 Tax=Fontibacillus phaseoli TaxID=1416533 RepID=A0A369BJ61_9BACL|nr:response regulator [Fontibacillus phaseoli]RCX21613.1 two-component system response regulator YesN [Fontibacillus phaseoli]